MSVFNPEDYWQISLKLVNQQPSDADYRTAANRAYYACHLLGCERGIIERTNSARDHSKLWEELRRRGMFWANKLEVLYRIREHADYHINSEDRDNVGCSYCKISAESMWGNAKAITEDILPRIKSMKKKDIKTPK